MEKELKQNTKDRNQRLERRGEARFQVHLKKELISRLDEVCYKKRMDKKIGAAEAIETWVKKMEETP